MSASPDTLFLPLENGDVPLAGPSLFLGAQSHSMLQNLDADLWQPFKPLADTLPQSRLLRTLPSSGAYALALVHIPKQVDEAKHWIACALLSLAADGWLILSAANDANGNRLEKWVKELGLSAQSVSKNKARAVWVRRPAVLSPQIENWRANGEKRMVAAGDIKFLSQPGVFGWDKIDAGSAMLADHLPQTLAGTGADFGAGTGYLSSRLLQKAEKIRTLYLAEADLRALECARENMAALNTACTLEYLWTDLSKPAALPALDFVVMNPPFHTGKKTDISLGQSFIETAAHHLKKGGRLYMVANAHLPYEQILRAKFSNVRALAEERGFKIYEAVK